MKQILSIMAIILVAGCSGADAKTAVPEKKLEVTTVYPSDSQGDAERPNGRTYTIVVEDAKIVVRYEGDTTFRVLSYYNIPRTTEKLAVYVASTAPGSTESPLTERWQSVKGGYTLTHYAEVSIRVTFRRGTNEASCFARVPVLPKSSGMIVNCGE